MSTEEKRKYSPDDSCRLQSHPLGWCLTKSHKLQTVLMHKMTGMLAQYYICQHLVAEENHHAARQYLVSL